MAKYKEHLCKNSCLGNCRKFIDRQMPVISFMKLLVSVSDQRQNL